MQDHNKLNVFWSSGNRFRSAERQRFDMCLFNSKYELIIITNKQHPFYDWENIVLYSSKES
jgi:hypothetical protein